MAKRHVNHKLTTIFYLLKEYKQSIRQMACSRLCATGFSAKFWLCWSCRGLRNWSIKYDDQFIGLITTVVHYCFELCHWYMIHWYTVHDSEKQWLLHRVSGLPQNAEFMDWPQDRSVCVSAEDRWFICNTVLPGKVENFPMQTWTFIQFPCMWSVYMIYFSKKCETFSVFSQFYGCLSQQQNMLQDYLRTATYQKAILLNDVDFKDKVCIYIPYLASLFWFTW